MLLKFSAKFVFLIVIFSLTLSGCRKYEVETETDIMFLGHKGAGSNNYNDINLENSIPSLKEALDELDGVEIDIEMSLDGTIYLYHNVDYNDKACFPTNAPRYIPKMRDKDIEATLLCHSDKKDRIYKFSEVIDLWNERSRNFYITIDVKASFGSGFFNDIGGKDLYFERLAAEFARILDDPSHTDKIFMEFDSSTFLKELNKHEATKPVICYYTGDNDVDDHLKQALKYDYDGISINYTKVTKESVEITKDSGMLIQIWTPYNKSELTQAFSMNPDFIQTDNKYAKRLLRVN